MDTNGSILMQRYELGRMLGKGTFAKVYHARNLKTGASVAIKVIDKGKILKIGMMDQIEREISVMRLVMHPNVVELHEVMASKTKIYFVMEYAKGGELFNKVARGKLKEGDARRYFQQLIGAVEYCHSRGVYHRDLKPENLLLDEHGNLKVSDFGLSALAQSKHQDGLLHTTCGTPAYVAPEVICRRGYDGCNADIWSCGVILYVLLSGHLPFHDSNLMVVYSKIRKAEFKFPDWFTPEQRRLVSKMLDPDPSARITMGKIMENSWFRKNLPRTEVRESCDNAAETAEKPSKCSNLNAFDIISYSAGLDLSGFFEGQQEEEEVRFTSKKQASAIISKLEDMARRLRLKVKQKGGGLLRMEGAKEGRKGVIGIEAEVFEITPEFHLVEVKKSSGDTLEYQNVVKQELRPGLKDIVWTWQGERQQPDLELWLPHLPDSDSNTVQLS